MYWKKVIKSLGLILLVLITVFIILAIRNTTAIYGGHTQKVDLQNFKIPSIPLYIKNISILSTEGNSFLPDRTVFITDGIIHSIDSTEVQRPGVKTVDGTGMYLIPGLIDAHVHLFKSKNDLLLYPANGVTEIRELIGEEDHLDWRREIEAGSLGPDMYITSPRLGSFGKIEGWFMEWTQGFKNISKPEEVEPLLRGYAEKGYDGVKIYSFLNKESYQAIITQAPTFGLDITGHIPWSVELSDVWQSGQSDITHLEELMNVFREEFGPIKTQHQADQFLLHCERRSREIAPQLKANNIHVTTTLWLTKSFVRQKFDLKNVLSEIELEYQNPGISEWDKWIPQGLGWLPKVNRYRLPDGLSKSERARQKIFWQAYGDACGAIVKVLADEGVTLMAGTDANLPPAVPGFSLHDELIALKDAGLSPVQVLRSSTATAADWMGSNSGKVEIGRTANLLLLKANPLEDISNTRKINAVILGGRYLERETLDRMLSSVKGANNSSRRESIDRFIVN